LRNYERYLRAALHRQWTDLKIATSLNSTDAGFSPTVSAANTIWLRVRVTGASPTQFQAGA
jgi:hypothetical protein